ncbi:hypothetical protein F5B21DRAFT_18911 [Xylaria acuta]|nr:hypothetical protein F5B21DRAFT_18911 [Xylaria acuta]
MTICQSNIASTISCCTCATPLSEVARLSESEDRWLECCPRAICGRCINDNPRFKSYCPYCQISQDKNNILPPGLKEPPSYTASTGTSIAFELAPPHFLNHAHDSINSLSLRYGVPASALRRANNISSDHLIMGRRTVIIPGQYYKGGVSLSPRPIEGEEEEKRKAKIRRWMVACKVHEYNVALLYLEQAGYDLQVATDTYFSDEEWERTHPAEAGRGKAIIGGSGSSLPVQRRR